jgi:glycine/D-amino acid oxidase-like deaminating enzyme/nitrite reductase/ring-hydroxylating ferredoxin subunit
MDTTSLWKRISEKTNYPKLTNDIEVDVAIIGGGITGITAALQFIGSGKKVAVLEAHRVGGITTGSSTGNLYVAVQPYYHNIISKFDVDTAKTIAQSREFAIDYIEKNVQTYNISCNFSRRPWFLYTYDENKISMLEKEVDAFKRIGHTLQYIDNLPLPFPFKKAVVMENQARFNPLQYVISLAKVLHQENVFIFENTPIIDLEEEQHLCTLNTIDGKKIRAENVIMATHTPIGVNMTQLFTAPYRSYVVSIRLKNNRYPEGHFWSLDASDFITCTHAISENEPELLMASGSHHKVGQDEDTSAHFRKLEKFLYQHFPVETIEYQWSAQHYQTADNIPYIGLANHHAKHTYLATGFFADGLTYGTVSGILVGDLIQQKENPWAKVYNSMRLTLGASAGFLIKENSNYFAQYYRDFPKSETEDYADLKPGEARVVELDREKWGVYKDEKAKLHIVSAVCTHMKCIIRWNNAEKTWDCPCHGSRFSTDGKVIEGPALVNLKKKDSPC